MHIEVITINPILYYVLGSILVFFSLYSLIYNYVNVFIHRRNRKKIYLPAYTLFASNMLMYNALMYNGCIVQYIPDPHNVTTIYVRAYPNTDPVILLLSTTSTILSTTAILIAWIKDKILKEKPANI